METTRHFTATTYVVEGGAALLHDHKRLDLWLPPGGHVDRDELPHEAARREVREETGLDVELVAETDDHLGENVRPLPKPRHLQLADINVHDGEVGHQHVDMIYYAEADARTIHPRDGEVSPGDWEWFAPADLDDDRLTHDVAETARLAIEAVDGA